VGGLLGEKSITGPYHYVIPFLLSWALTLLNTYLIYRFFPKPSPAIQKVQPREKQSYLTLLIRGCAICFDQRIRTYAFLLFVLQFTLAVFFQLSSLRLVERFHYSSLQVGVFTTFLGACFSGGIFFVIHVLLHRIRHVRLLHIGIVLMLAATLCTGYWEDSTRAAWVSVVPLMLGIAMMFNVLLSFVSNAVTEHEQGDAMGSGIALKALGWLLASALVGIGYPHLALILSVQFVLLLIALACSLRVK
jgi:predicted MFS family arabinose efflux permease